MPPVVRIVIIVGAVIAMGVVSMLVINRAEQSQEALPYYGKLPDFEFSAQSGHLFKQTDMLGQITVADFMFTRCHGPCPVMAVNMGSLYEYYADSPDIHFLSISVDPEYDSVAVLQAYAEKLQVTDSRWKFIRGEMAKVVELCEQGFKLPAENLPGMHSTKFILIDKAGYIRGYYDGTDFDAMEKIKSDIAFLKDNEQ